MHSFNLSTLNPVKGLQGLAGGLGITSGLMGLGLAGAIGLGGINIVKAGMRDEVAGVRMETVFKDRARTLKPLLDRFAGKTPLSKNDLYAGAIKLKSSGMQTGNIINYLRMMGDVAGGDANRLSSVVTAVGRTHSRGYMQGEEFNMILDATGANLLKVIGELPKYNKSMDEMFKLMRQGGVTSQMVKEGFIELTKTGGQFGEMMQKVSETTQGKLTTIADRIDSIMVTLSKKAHPFIHKVLDKVEWYLNRAWDSHPEPLRDKNLIPFLKDNYKKGDTWETLRDRIIEKKLLDVGSLGGSLKENWKLLKRDDVIEDLKEKEGGIYWFTTNSAEYDRLREKYRGKLPEILSKETKASILDDNLKGLFVENVMGKKNFNPPVKTTKTAKKDTDKPIKDVYDSISTEQVQNITINIQQMNGINAPNLSTVGNEKVIEGVNELKPVISGVLSTIGVSI